VKSRRHLGCARCRIRLHASAAEIELLEGACPVCGASLDISSVSSVMGFRLFDLGVFRDQEPNAPPSVAMSASARAHSELP
jgi:hypothetical protein